MNQVPSLEEQLKVLAREAEFTLEELEANRAGKMLPAQVARHRPGAGGFIFFLLLGLFGLAGGVGGALFFYDSLRKPVDRVDMNGVYALAIGGLVIGLGFIAFAVSVHSGSRSTRTELDRGDCFFWDIEFAFTREDLTFKDYFYVRRGDQQLQIPRNVARKMRPGARYRVYIAAGRLISLEPRERGA